MLYAHPAEHRPDPDMLAIPTTQMTD